MECIYIKVPVYVKLWLQYHYCDNKEGVIRIQRDMAEVQQVLYENIVRYTFKHNPSSRPMFCISKQMYNLNKENAPLEFRDHLPQPERLKEYVGIAIEHEHYVKGRLIPCDNTACLKYDSARFVHNYLTEAFFKDIEKWISDWPELAKASGESPDMLNGVQVYLAKHKIPIEQDTAVIRVIYRGNRRSKMQLKKC